MDYILILIVIILDLNYIIFAAKSTNKLILPLNKTCIDNISGENGVCRYLSDCPDILKTWKYIEQPVRPSICGLNGNKIIVCCPSQGKGLIKETIRFIKFNKTCIVPETGEYGRIIKEKHCPFAKEQTDKGIILPRACPYEICSDMICCPNTKRTRLRQQCQHEDVEDLLLYKRLNANYECIVPTLNKTGRYTDSESCSFYSEWIKNNITLPKVCDWDNCEDFVCCPETHLANTRCSTYDTSHYDYIDYSAGSCTMKGTNVKGVCTSDQNCPSQTLDKKDYTVCGKDCCSDFICCPLPELNKLSRSVAACTTYSKAVFEEIKVVRFPPLQIDQQRNCYTVQPAGGILADPKEFPHMAVLGYDGIEGVDWHCGGSLISEKFIITAGHCLASANGIPVKYARLGIIDLNVKNDPGDCPEEYLVAERIRHPKYSSQSVYNDIALLRMDRKVEFTPDIRPICLPTSEEIPEYLRACGFGYTEYTGKRTEKLLKVSLSPSDYKECNESFKFFFNRKFNGINTQTQFCAGSRDTIEDTCRGDSGGPIEGSNHEFYRMATLYGITSFGKECGIKGQSAIYTKVFPFIKWIESVVWSK